MGDNNTENNNEINMDEKDINKSERYKKAIRSRIIAIVGLILFLALLVILIAYGIKFLSSRIVIKTSESVTTASDSLEEALSASSEEEIDEIIETLLSEAEVSASEEVTEPVVDPAEELENKVKAIIDEMSDEEKVAGLFIVTPEQLTGVDLAVVAGEGTETALSKYPVCGIVYNEGNILDEEQFKEMISNTKNYSKYDLFLCMEEGFGKDAVLANKLSYEPTMDASAILDSMDPYNGHTQAEAVSAYLGKFGINTVLSLDDLEPCFTVDEEGEPTASDDSKAMFGNDIIIAGQMAMQTVAGFASCGMYVSVGTFPYMQDADYSPDKKYMTKDEYSENGAHIFEASIWSGAQMVSVGCVNTPDMTGDDTPACFSKKIIDDYLRGEWGYEDLIVITDNLSNSEITENYDSKEACLLAIDAGADILYCPENFEEAYDAVLSAVKDGTVSRERIEKSLRRIFLVKYANNN